MQSHAEVNARACWCHPAVDILPMTPDGAQPLIVYHLAGGVSNCAFGLPTHKMQVVVLGAQRLWLLLVDPNGV